MKKIIIIQVLIFTGSAYADYNSLNQNCEPSGINANIKFKYDPVAFYKSQVEAIIKDRNNYIQTRRLEKLNEKHAEEKSALETKQLMETMNELGVETYNDSKSRRKLTAELQAIDLEIQAMSNDLDQAFMDWYAKCLTYSKYRSGIQ
jgi:hypothetical protein